MFVLVAIKIRALGTILLKLPVATAIVNIIVIVIASNNSSSFESTSNGNANATVQGPIFWIPLRCELFKTTCHSTMPPNTCHFGDDENCINPSRHNIP